MTFFHFHFHVLPSAAEYETSKLNTIFVLHFQYTYTEDQTNMRTFVNIFPLTRKIVIAKW